MRRASLCEPGKAYASQSSRSKFNSGSTGLCQNAPRYSIVIARADGSRCFLLENRVQRTPVFDNPRVSVPLVPALTETQLSPNLSKKPMRGLQPHWGK